MATKIFNAVGWLGVGLIAFAAIRIQFFTGSQDQYSYYALWAGLAAVLVYLASQWREIAAVFSRRGARYGGLAATSVLIVLGIVIAVNYIGKRQNKRWDLTAAQQYTLADQSRNVLAKLDAPLDITVFVVDDQRQAYEDRLSEYQYASSQVRIEYVDPAKDPIRAQQNQITDNGTIVVSHKGRTARTTMNTEQDITGAIIKTVSGEQRKVYFTQGHGEKDTAAEDNRIGYSAISQALQTENYVVEKVVLAQTGAVPEDASIVVVAGPTTDFFAPEIEALKAYLGRQGKLLLLLDPVERPEAPELTGLLALAKEWGVDPGGNIVVDASPMGRMFGLSALVPVAANYPSHPITDRFSVITAFPLTRALTLDPGPEGRTAQAIVESSAQSWAESDLKSLTTGGTPDMNEETGDKPGPLTLGAAVSVAAPSDKPADPATPEAPKPEARVVVFGDSDFASNRFLGVQGNRDLFMNVMGWLSQQENLISIRPKQAEDRRLTMTAGAQSFINLMALAVIPLTILGAGVYSWWRRR